MPAKHIIAKRWTGLIPIAGIYYSGGAPADPWTPILPLRSFNTAYASPSGNTWTATNTSNSSVAGSGTGSRTGCSLNYALTNCALGDKIILTKGASYPGPYTLPNKGAGTDYIYICSSGDPGQGGTGLPAEGTRVVAGDATSMAKITITAAASAAAITTATGAHHFRFVGVEVTAGPTTTDFVYSMVSIYNSETSNANVPHHIIFDRCYIHGGTSTTHSGRRGLLLTGEYIAIVDCRVSDFYDDGYDSQGAWIYQGDGPFWIVNNYLNAASENLMSGGEDPLIPNSVPSDVTIRHNHFYKPLAWVGAGHNCKNLLEFKNVQRALIEHNTFENCFPDGQAGYFFLITPRNQSGTAPWCVTKDITFRLNKVIGTVSNGVSLSGRDVNPGYETQVTERVLFENNQILGDGSNGGAGYYMNCGNGFQYVTFQHNTCISGSYPSFTNSGSAFLNTHFRCRNNVFSGGNKTPFTEFEWAGDSKIGAVPTLAQYFSDYTFDYNVMTKCNSSTAVNPAGNFFPAANANVGFTNYAGGDFSLTGASAYHNAASDGTDCGANYTALNAAVA